MSGRGHGSTRGSRRWRPGWQMTVFVAVMLPLVLGLGVWQLQRAAEMRGYEDRYFQRVGMLPRTPPRDLTGAQFLRVRLVGHYEPGRHYLVDNRPRRGQPGYWVVSRFVAADGRRWLVNRGWIAAPSSREALPAVLAPAGTTELVGVLWPDTGLPLLLAPDPWPGDWPKRVQRLDISRMAAADEAVVAVEVRLEPGQPGVYRAAPVDVAFSPQRHVGYAVQWFALGAALLAGYLFFAFRRRE